MDLMLPDKIYISTALDSLLDRLNYLKKADKVSLSFFYVDSISPDTIVILIALSKYIFDYTGNMVIWKDIKDTFYAYFYNAKIKDIPFIKLESLSLREFINTVIQPKNIIQKLNMSEIRIIDNPIQCHEIIDYTNDILIDWFQYNTDRKHFLKQISEYIMHIAGNSLEHSESRGFGICYYALQKIFHNNKPRIKVAFGDTGMGIKNSLNNTNMILLNRDALAIHKAFLEGFSCREDQSGGLGFIAVRNLLRQYGGEISIRSGTAVMSFDPQSSNPRFNLFRYSLPGTQTIFQIY